MKKHFLIILILISFTFVSSRFINKNENVNFYQDISDNLILNENEVIKKGSEINKFYANLPEGFEIPEDFLSQRMLKEYGSMFVAQNDVVLPPKVVFNSDEDVTNWQLQINTLQEKIGGSIVELQTPAMIALKKAIEEAKEKRLSITPRGGSHAGKRNYTRTVTNWKSRVNPGLTYWVNKGKLKSVEAERIRNLPIKEQIVEIFKLEEEGILFGKYNANLIIYSVAPPGTSQHISMLAFDVNEHDNKRVREILANNGWFQTVFSDLQHFTYLGVNEEVLPELGLVKVHREGRTFWIPG